MILLFMACASAPVRLLVVGEADEPLADAVAVGNDDQYDAGSDGIIELPPLSHPILLQVQASGHLSEPVVVGPTASGPVRVQMLEDGGGLRKVIHTAGDVMLGRRYEEPAEGPPLITPGDGGTSAAKVVSDAAAAFGLADLRIVNLETVVGDFSMEEAYPGKRFLLLTPPDGLGALTHLNVDVASLANNHQRDWLDAGVASTLENLDARKLAHLGAGRDEEEAATGRRVDLGDFPVAILSYTSVDGDYVNDQYPLDDSSMPSDTPQEDRWEWESRSWGAPEFDIPVAPRRIGGAWAVIHAAESSLPEMEHGLLWESALQVYPELQDWVARRGHGGANRWDEKTATSAIASARIAARIVIVQLHMGYQFAEARGDGVEAAAHAAIDAGADLVIAHHPHVLQGLEWYRGHLIAWSTGNFVFDQDFLSTFRSAFVRTVWEADGSLLQARLVPMFLDQYRPVPVTGWLAKDTLAGLWAGSALEAVAQRGSDLGVRSVATNRIDGASIPVFREEHGTAVLTEGSIPSEAEIWKVPETGRLSVEAPLLQFTGSAKGVEVGRSVFGLGHFEDMDADGSAGDTVGWTWDSDNIRLSSEGYLEFRRLPGTSGRISARTLARVPLRAHRLYADVEGKSPLDGDATWSFLVRYRTTGEADLSRIRLALYHFDDLDPTEDPESTLLREVSIPLPASRSWVESDFRLSAADLAPVNGLSANAMLIYVDQDTPRSWESHLLLDELEVVEWRSGGEEPDGWSRVDFLQSEDGKEHGVKVERANW